MGRGGGFGGGRGEAWFWIGVGGVATILVDWRLKSVSLVYKTCLFWNLEQVETVIQEMELTQCGRQGTLTLWRLSQANNRVWESLSFCFLLQAESCRSCNSCRNF